MELIATRTRDDFLRFGRALADALQDHYGEAPCTISLGGDGNSGKSLIALAADARLHPERYPFGITPDLDIHGKIGETALGRQSVFFSDGLPHIYNAEDASAGAWLETAKNPGLKIAFLSNVWNWSELTRDAHDAAAIGRNKIPVQGRVDVRALGNGGFAREISLRFFETGLGQKIKAHFAAPGASGPRIQAGPVDPQPPAKAPGNAKPYNHG